MSYVSHHVARHVGSRTSRHEPAAGVTVRVRIVPEPLPSDPDVLAGLVREAFPRASSISVTRASPGRLAVVHRAVVDGVRYYLRRAEAPGQDLTTDALVLERLRARDVRVPGIVAASPPAAAFP